MAEAALIVNPFASLVTEVRVRAVERVLAPLVDVTTVLTERPGHAAELAAMARGRGCKAIFVFSGDGGYNEVLNGADALVPLGFIPGGGTSVLPRALGLPRDPLAAAVRLAEALAARRTRRITLGRVNGRRFGFSAGLGFAAEAVRRVEARGRSAEGRRAGDVAFVWTILRMLAGHRARFDPALEVVGLGRAAFAFVANGDPYTYAGRLGIHLAPEARFELGLDLVAPARVRARTLPRLLGVLLAGRGRAGVRGILYGHDLDRIEIRCDVPLPLQADGEDLGDVEQALFEAEREAVSVLV